MNAVISSQSTTSSIRSSFSFNDMPKLCRFCFHQLIDDLPQIDIFSSKIGTSTILDVVKTYFAIYEERSYEQYLHGRSWTTNHIEVIDFQLNTENHELSCICTDCLQVVVESTWFANKLRLHNLKSMATTTLCNVLSNCTLVATLGDVVPNEKVMPCWNYERRRNNDELSNFWDACIFCFQHNSSLLFDIFLSHIMGSSIADVIKTLSTICKQEHIYEMIHLRKSLKKTITVIDFQCNIADSKITPRKLCLNCLMPIIKQKAFIEQIRKTNDALPIIGHTSKLDGSIEFNIPFRNLQEILSNCTLMTTEYETISTSHIMKVLNKMTTIKEEDVSHLGPLDTIVELSEPDLSTTSAIVEEQIVFCKYCNKDIFKCSSFEDHVLQCMKKDVVHAVDTHNRALCDNCIDVVFRKEEVMAKLPMESFKNCCVCKLSLYQTRDNFDIDLTYREFLTKYFE